MVRRAGAILLAAAVCACGADQWVSCWVASPHGPYPSGNAVAEPDLRDVLPASGAEDQTFRLIVKPDIRRPRIRLRFSNVFGSKPLQLDGVYAGTNGGAGTVLAHTNRPVTFGGKPGVRIEPCQFAYSDAVIVAAAARPAKLAVSFHVAGTSGPLTWHAKALTTSYLSAPHSGSHGGEEASDSFPFTTTSWFLLDDVETLAPEGTGVIAALGDSITDGTNSTINGDDRWPDFLSERVHARFGDRLVVVNAGIGGNKIVARAAYDPAKPVSGGPSALERLDRDVLGIPGLSTVIWLEGINDLGANASVAEIVGGLRQGVARLHERRIRVIGATITSALNSTPTQGTPEVDAKRKDINRFIRAGGVFDGMADFDAVTVDTKTGALRLEFQPNSSIGGAGDRLHPNRAGYQAMGRAVDLGMLAPR